MTQPNPPKDQSHHAQAAEAHQQLVLAIVTVSDTRTAETDVNGHFLHEAIAALGHRVGAYHIVPDEPVEIERLLDELTDKKGDTAVQLILFNGGTPIAWYGPVHRWIRACDVLLGLDAEVIVAGHGPISTKDDVREMRDYLHYVTDKARPLWEDGMDYLAAAYHHRQVTS